MTNHIAPHSPYVLRDALSILTRNLETLKWTLTKLFRPVWLFTIAVYIEVSLSTPGPCSNFPEIVKRKPVEKAKEKFLSRRNEYFPKEKGNKNLSLLEEWVFPKR